MAVEGLNGELLKGAAESGVPIEIEMAGYKVSMYVRRLEAWEIAPPDPKSYRVHPLTVDTRLTGNHARSVGR